MALEPGYCAESPPQSTGGECVQACHRGAPDDTAHRHLYIDPDRRSKGDMHGTVTKLDGLGALKNPARMPFFKRDQEVVGGVHLEILQEEYLRSARM